MPLSTETVKTRKIHPESSIFAFLFLKLNIHNITLPFKHNRILTVFSYLIQNSHGKQGSTKVESNPFVKKTTKSSKYGKEVKIACCGCFPVANTIRDD